MLFSKSKAFIGSIFAVIALVGLPASADSVRGSLGSTITTGGAATAAPVSLNILPTTTLGCVSEGGHLATEKCWRFYGGTVLTLTSYTYSDKGQDFTIETEAQFTSGAEPTINLEIWVDGYKLGWATTGDYADSGVDLITANTISRKITVQGTNTNRTIQIIGRSLTRDAIIWQSHLEIQPISGVVGNISNGTISSY